MSLWACPTHGLYGGDVFCPTCGGTGEYVTLSPLERAKATHRAMRSVDEMVGLDRERAPVDRNPEGEKPQALSAKHESAVGEAEAPCHGTAGAQGGDA